MAWGISPRLTERLSIFPQQQIHCCTGCRSVYEILQTNNLCGYYDFDERARLSFKQTKASRFEYLDDEAVRRALLQFSDGTIAKTTLRVSLRRLLPVGTAVVAVLLIVRGLALGVPYLRPQLAFSLVVPTAAPACHAH